MDIHSLIEMAHMFYRVCPTVVNGKRWLMGLLRKYCPFNPAGEGRLGNLIQRFAYSIISQTSARRALVSMFVMVFFIIGERLAWWSSCPSPITSILFIIRGDIRSRGSLLLLCMAQLLL